MYRHRAKPALLLHGWLRERGHHRRRRLPLLENRSTSRDDDQYRGQSPQRDPGPYAPRKRGGSSGQTLHGRTRWQQNLESRLRLGPLATSRPPEAATASSSASLAIAFIVP